MGLRFYLSNKNNSRCSVNVGYEISIIYLENHTGSNALAGMKHLITPSNGSQISSSGITFELIRNANSWALPKPTELDGLRWGPVNFFMSSPDDSYALALELS